MVMLPNDIHIHLKSRQEILMPPTKLPSYTHPEKTPIDSMDFIHDVNTLKEEQ